MWKQSTRGKTSVIVRHTNLIQVKWRAGGLARAPHSSFTSSWPTYQFCKIPSIDTIGATVKTRRNKVFQLGTEQNLMTPRSLKTHELFLIEQGVHSKLRVCWWTCSEQTNSPWPGRSQSIKQQPHSDCKCTTPNNKLHWPKHDQKRQRRQMHGCVNPQHGTVIKHGKHSEWDFQFFILISLEGRRGSHYCARKVASALARLVRWPFSHARTLNLCFFCTSNPLPLHLTWFIELESLF